MECAEVAYLLLPRIQLSGRPYPTPVLERDRLDEATKFESMSIQFKYSQSQTRSVLGVSDIENDKSWREFIVSQWSSPRVYSS